MRIIAKDLTVQQRDHNKKKKSWKNKTTTKSIEREKNNGQ